MQFQTEEEKKKKKNRDGKKKKTFRNEKIFKKTNLLSSIVTKVSKIMVQVCKKHFSISFFFIFCFFFQLPGLHKIASQEITQNKVIMIEINNLFSIDDLSK